MGPREEPTRYERQQRVGGGGEGDVYRGRYVGPSGGTPVPVALKLYRHPVGASPDWPHDGTWLQISDQAALLAGLPEHPHLVRIREVFLGAVSSAALDADPASPRKDFRTPVVVMEWVEGRPLLEALERPVPLEQRLRWIRELAEALELLRSVSRTHSNPLVHGDIKPGNCVIDPQRGLVLIDTGAVHRVEAGGPGRGLRTPQFSAPEVLAAPGRRRTPAADLYSLGATAVLLLTGAPPVTADDPDYLRLTEQRLSELRLLPRRRRRHDAALRRLLLMPLDPDPAVRAAVDPVDWADRLRDTAIGGRTRRVVLRSALAAVAALAAILLVANVVRALQPPPAPTVVVDRTSGFVPFGERWGTVQSAADGATLTVTPPLGDDRYSHLWGMHLPVRLCSSTVEFEVHPQNAVSGDGFGFSVAPRSTVLDDQPYGFSLQYEYEPASVNAVPGYYVRTAELPGGAWESAPDAVPAPALTSPRRIRVTAVGTVVGIAVDGRTLVEYDIPAVECGGVSLRTWGSGFTFSGVHIEGT